jgi:hypothetical protein
MVRKIYPPTPTKTDEEKFVPKMLGARPQVGVTTTCQVAPMGNDDTPPPLMATVPDMEADLAQICSTSKWPNGSVGHRGAHSAHFWRERERTTDVAIQHRARAM